MSVLQEYAPDFYGEVKARGRDYYRRGDVTIIAKAPRLVSAKVRGTGLYTTMIRWDPNDGPHYSCTCPYYQDHGDPCKHAWATVLQANAEGVLPDPHRLGPAGDEEEAEGRAGLSAPSAAAVPAIDPVDDRDEDEFEGEDVLPPSPYRSAWQPKKSYGQSQSQSDKQRSKAPDPTAWKKQFTKLTQSMLGASTTHGGLTPVAQALAHAWPANRRVVYVIDRPATVESKGLSVELAYEQAKRDGQWERPKHLKLARDQIAQLPEEADRQIVQMLMGARRGDHGYYGYYDYESPRKFEVPESAYDTLLRMMCKTGRCRLRTGQGQEIPEPLAWDDGSPWEFWLEVKPSAGGRYYVLDASLRRTRPAEEPPSAGPEEPDEARKEPETSNGNGQANGYANGEKAAAQMPAQGQVQGPVLGPVPPPPAGPVVEKMAVTEPSMLVRGGLVFTGGKVAKLNDFGAFELLTAVREGTKLSVPLDQRGELMKTLFGLPRLPRLDLPAELRVAERRPAPKPRLTIKKPAKSSYYSDDRLVGILSFDYDGKTVTPNDAGEVVYSPPGEEGEAANAAAAKPSEMKPAGATPVEAKPGDQAAETRPVGGKTGAADEVNSAAAEAAALPGAGAQPEAATSESQVVEEPPTAPAGRVLYRDLPREAAYATRLLQLGFKEANDYGYYSSNRGPSLRLPPTKLPKVVAELTREGWFVEAEGKLYRQPGEFNVHVQSGIDWFELHGEVDFGGQTATLPQLLAALRRGENSVRLDDGTFGLLPQEWLKKYAPLAGMGEDEQDHLRFSARQVGFLDALLSGMPEATFDAGFTRVRDELMRFEGIKPLGAPTTFQGVLRAYQRDGLGWMSFLRRFGFGGCLADDMGLGKTVQVLALLESRRQLRPPRPDAATGASGVNGEAKDTKDAKSTENKADNGKDAAAPAAAANVEAATLPTSPPPHSPTSSSDVPGPSLVVAPRSLVFNWMQEAARFTPNLRVLDHTQATRVKGSEHFADYDLILTTYGTLRRDAGYFKDVRFDYAVLDEAQAIKNASSESAKAARLLKAEHRLALSGTPVQNHLGELWSLFEFLNPGMMGSATVFRETTQRATANDPETRTALARAMRPFILRRTKEQVAKDLPQKLEQTLYCELEATQRKLYNDLRDYYRTSLLDRIAKEGMNKAKIQVLEALLRLRQAACHPGLIDKAKAKEGSAKLDTLMDQVGEVLEENHKVLIFSQFTTFLSIVRKRLDAAGTVYEYLDGKTRDRQARVERFQNDPACKLFLISLKAGGLGLNLTAAEYVFLLDPWWNPAVEAQAIDRAHRIGQTRQVFAYRLIAKDTVEEKVLQLQQTKKDLADAIINADNSLIRTLKRDDLELLLS